MKKPVGLYVHIPFCKNKCPYCDFYSVKPDEGSVEAYIRAVRAKLAAFDRPFDSVYFGGGTPSLLGADRLAEIASVANRVPGCEFTVECNPSDAAADFDFESAAASGINRISLGLQSASDEERRALGRRAGRGEVLRSIKRAESAGIKNVSLDLIIAAPRQTRESLGRSVEFCEASGATHVSAYILKIEKNTPFYRIKDSLALPDEDETCELYLEAAAELEKAGFKQYEISNFAKRGFESAHNLKYWRCEEYLGVGAAAHSFIDGKRFFYRSDVGAFISGEPPVADGTGGDEEEYVMLALRLSEGLIFKNYEKRFGKPLGENVVAKARKLEKLGFAKVAAGSFSLTPKGFLLSNPIIAEITDELSKNPRT